MKYLTILIFSFFFFVNSTAQTYDLQFVSIQNDKTVGGSYKTKVQVRKGTGADFQVGNSNIRINFNDAGLSPLVEPIFTEHNFDNNASSAYSDMTSAGSAGSIISINIVLNVANTGTPTISADWVDVATLAFTIDDTNESSGLTFRTSSPNTVLFDDDQSSILTQGTFTGLNEPLGVVLPVEWVSFEAVALGSIAKLTWATASELANDRFEVEHSPNGREWQYIGEVAANGNSEALANYSFFHKKPVAGNNYYRLRQIDLDGRSELSKVANVFFPKDSQLSILIFPNPATDYLHVEWVNETSETPAMLTLVTMKGQLVKQQFLENDITRLELPGGLPNGIYSLSITSTSGNILANEKIVLQ